MTVDEYESILVDLIQRKRITLDEAAELLKKFLAGDFEEDDLPLPIAEAKKRDDDAWLLLFSLQLSINRKTLIERRRERGRVRRLFVVYATDDALSLTDRDITLHQWHSETMGIIGGAVLASWLAGNGTDGTRPSNDDQVSRQLDYLYRFAAETHARRALDDPFSLEYMVNRSLMYGGAVRGAWFLGNESIYSGYGYVSQYIPIDDRGTCSPCHNAAGYYLPGDGPMPGDICLGGDACRCERVTIYAPEIYAQLTGIVV